MLEEIIALQETLKSKLLDNQPGTNPIQRLESLAMIAVDAIAELKGIIKKLDRKDVETLISVQKKYIPAIYGEYIYHAALHNLELNKPVGSALKAYYTREQDKLERFFDTHREFLGYYRSGKTELDELYFLPAGNKQPLLIDYYTPMILDPFCTRWSFLAAQSMAYERLLNGVMQLQSDLEPNPHREHIPDLIWTESNTDMVELVYALFAAGSFNKGKVTINDVVRFLEKAFGLQMGKTNTIFQEILRRKQSIIFIEKLRSALDSYITNLEERQR